MSLVTPLVVPLDDSLVKPSVNNDAAIFAARSVLGEKWPFKNSLVGTKTTTATFTRASTQAYTDLNGNAQVAAINEPAYRGGIILQGAHDAEADTYLTVSTTGWDVNDCALYGVCVYDQSYNGSFPCLFSSEVDASNRSRITINPAGNNIFFQKRVGGTSLNAIVSSITVSQGDTIRWLMLMDSTNGMTFYVELNGVLYPAGTNSDTANLPLDTTATIGANVGAINIAGGVYKDLKRFSSSSVEFKGAQYA